MSFGNHLRILLDERKMTQKELATLLNIAPSTLGGYIQNTREPDFSTLKIIAEYFDVSIDYLLDYPFDKKTTLKEKEMLRIFRSLTDEQQSICLEQCKVFVRMNCEEQMKKRMSS